MTIYGSIDSYINDNGSKNKVPFDEKINLNAVLSDINYNYLIDYLTSINSSILNNIRNMDLYEIASLMHIVEETDNNFKPLNVGLLFFNDNPESFFPHCRIEIVNNSNPTGQGMEKKIFTGPIHYQLKNTLLYIKSIVLAEKVFKVDDKAEAIRVWNYSYEAIVEFLTNAIYHKSYQYHEPITIRIEKDKIEIISAPGPDKSISDHSIRNLQMRSRRYRNKRIGEFLKELHFTKGRNTGIPTAIKRIKENGSPLPEFLTDDERTFFSVIVPIHECFRK